MCSQIIRIHTAVEHSRSSHTLCLVEAGHYAITFRFYDYYKKEASSYLHRIAP